MCRLAQMQACAGTQHGCPCQMLMRRSEQKPSPRIKYLRPTQDPWHISFLTQIRSRTQGCRPTARGLRGVRSGAFPYLDDLPVPLLQARHGLVERQARHLPPRTSVIVPAVPANFRASIFTKDRRYPHVQVPVLTDEWVKGWVGGRAENLPQPTNRLRRLGRRALPQDVLHALADALHPQHGSLKSWRSRPLR